MGVIGACQDSVQTICTVSWIKGGFLDCASQVRRILVIKIVGTRIRSEVFDLNMPSLWTLPRFCGFPNIVYGSQGARLPRNLQTHTKFHASGRNFLS